LSDIDRPAELDDPDLASLRFFERQLPKRWIWPLAAGAGGRQRGFADLARATGARLAIVDSLRRPVWQERLAALAPDLVVSIRFSHIFPASLLAIPRLGTVNLHPGDLPVYAGLFTPFHQLMDGRPSLGCTLHWVDAGIDTGAMLAKRFLPVAPDRSLLWHVAHVYPPGIEPLLELIADLRRGRVPPGEVQEPGSRRYHRLPDAAAFARFRAAGWRVVDHGDYEELLAGYLPVAPVGRPLAVDAAS
jgi:methionyl-tRNA formyltransferase